MIKQPLQTDKIVFKNRIVYPPICIRKAAPDGSVSEDILAHYDKMSRGGNFSLVTIEHCFIAPEGRASKGQLSVGEDDKVSGLKKLAETIKANGSKVILQMNHVGGSREAGVIDDLALLGPSPVKNPKSGLVPQEMTKQDIAQIVAAFADAAGRVVKAGYDGVEIHSAHSYLLNQFYSPLTNRREDEYGGALENRLRFHLEVIHAVRKAVGPDFPVFLRLGACDHMTGGNCVEDAVKAALIFEQAGIDVLDISGGMCGRDNPDDQGPGYFGPETAAIKEAVSIPVICTGGVKEPQDAEALLKDGVADLIGIGRAAMSDPGWAARAMSE